MVCQTINVSFAPTIPTVSSLGLVQRTNQPVVDITWYQDVAGKVKITVDGSFSSELTYNAGNNAAIATNLTVAKVYTICVVGV